LQVNDLRSAYSRCSRPGDRLVSYWAGFAQPDAFSGSSTTCAVGWVPAT
jgi:hypothetical protein